MDLISAAGFLIQRAVQTATQLQQHPKEKEGRTNLTSLRDKNNIGTTETSLPPIRSSAYRVTLSPAAQQQLALNRAAV